MTRAPLGDATACSGILLNPHSLHTLYYNLHQIFCKFNLYTGDFVVLFRTCDTYCMSVMFKVWFFFCHGKFFLTQIKEKDDDFGPYE